MNVLSIELRKEKRTGVIPVLLAVGVLGAAYAFVNFLVRKDTLLNLPLAPMDVLLTQLYGVIMILNLFGIVVATCMIYNMEFKGSAIKKMYMLPMSVPAMYLCKFLILTVLFLNSGMGKDEAAAYTTISLVFASVVLTGLNIYPLITTWGGAGSLVPITGFANSVVAPAIEYKKEGQVFGIGCKIFTISGPVILYGILSSWILGVIYLIVVSLRAV